MNNICLIGYRCSGKTTLGKILAERLGYVFVDVDDLITEKIGMSIAEFIEKEEWKKFRDIEERTLKEVLRGTGQVIGCGGGTILKESNRKIMRKKSLVIWLKVDKENIMKRMDNDPKTSSLRPSLTGKNVMEEVEEVLKERTPIYERTSHFVVNLNRSVAEAAKETMEIIRGRNEHE